MRLARYALALALLTPSALLAQQLPIWHSPSAGVPLANDLDSSAPHNTCFRGRPQQECSAFFLTEWSWALRFGDGAYQGGDNWYWTWQFGWMRNVGSRDALGASLFLGAETDRLDQSGPTIGIKARYRRWLGPKVALEVAAGPAVGGWVIAHSALVYGDWVAFEVQAEPGQKIFDDRYFATYAGVRFGSYPGTVLGIVAPLVVLLVVATGYEAD